MSFNMPKCKITVIKRAFFKDLIDEYIDEEFSPKGPCECFEDGQEFIIDPTTMPEELTACCPWAWGDIRKDIVSIASGADLVGLKTKGVAIAGCTDWFRPVLFKIERLEE